MVLFERLRAPAAVAFPLFFYFWQIRHVHAVVSCLQFVEGSCIKGGRFVTLRNPNNKSELLNIDIAGFPSIHRIVLSNRTS